MASTSGEENVDGDLELHNNIDENSENDNENIVSPPLSHINTEYDSEEGDSGYQQVISKKKQRNNRLGNYHVSSEPNTEKTVNLYFQNNCQLTEGERISWATQFINK